MNTTFRERQRKVARKFVDYEEDEDEVTESTKNVCTETAQVKEQDHVDEFIDAEPTGEKAFGDEMKEV